MRRLVFSLVLFLGVVVAGCDSSSDSDDSARWVVDAGALRLAVSKSPWRMTFHDADGVEIFAENQNRDGGPVGSLGLFPGPPADGSGGQPVLPPLELGEPSVPPHRQQGWVRASELVDSRRDGDTWRGTLATTDPEWVLEIRARRESAGVISVTVGAVGGGVQAVGVGFGAVEGERFVGFGERGNAVDQAGNVIENYVAEGPYQDADYGIINAVIPAWGVRWRPDTTYFPVPWLLSSRGYGVLLDNDEISYHRLGAEHRDAWGMEVESDSMSFRVFAGPKPADALRRYTDAVGRQPADYAPWFFGPWVQSDRDDRIDELHAADVPTSVTATYTHYFPCGSQRGREDSMRERTAARNAAGTAVHTYFNPMICADYVPEFDIAEQMNALIKNAAGGTYTYDYFTSRFFTVSQFDFHSDNGVAAYKVHTDEALSHGYEGWMEDFGEYTPLDARSADGTTGTAFHNRYARDYHCGVAAATADAGKPLARFARSGWTGSAACTPIVWGGDPTTGFGFDGLESSIYQALSIGTSGVGIWGSDIGGFFSFDPHHLTAELFDRWIAFGAMSVVMRSQKDGLNFTTSERPHLWDPEHRELWRKYAKLHTQLYPYLQAAAEEYYETGMPIMRHHLLSYPDDAEAHGRDDQYLFGPDLLVAPVVGESEVTRSLYLPPGTWVEWWRSVYYLGNEGSFQLSEALLHDGETVLTVDAPRGEIPIFVRAGSVIPMLPPDVYTLADHGNDPSIVHLSDRRDELHLMAFPRGESSGTFYDTGTYLSTELTRSWSLAIDDVDSRLLHLRVSLRTLENPFEPCTVKLGGAALSEVEWDFDESTGVLSVRYESADGVLEVGGC